MSHLKLESNIFFIKILLLLILGTNFSCKKSSIYKDEIITENDNYNMVGLIAEDTSLKLNIQVEYFDIDSNKIVLKNYITPCIVGGYKTTLNYKIYSAALADGAAWETSKRSIIDYTNKNYFKIKNLNSTSINYFIYGVMNKNKFIDKEELININSIPNFDNYNDAGKIINYKLLNEAIQEINFTGSFIHYFPIGNYKNIPVYYMLNPTSLINQSIADFDDIQTNKYSFKKLYLNNDNIVFGKDSVKKNWSIFEIMNLYQANQIINPKVKTYIYLQSSYNYSYEKKLYGKILPQSNIINSAETPLTDELLLFGNY